MFVCACVRDTEIQRQAVQGGLGVETTLGALLET